MLYRTGTLEKKKNKKQQHKKAKRHSIKNILTQAFQFLFQKGFHKIGLFFEMGKKRLIIKRKKIRNIGLSYGLNSLIFFIRIIRGMELPFTIGCELSEHFG